MKLFETSLAKKIDAFHDVNDFYKAVLVLVLCLPLFLINIRNDIDWGDDNANYIMQAKYIAQGIPQSETQYIFNSDYSVLGPPAYPMGFPLLLSGVYFYKGMNLHAFNYAITLALVFLCVLLFFYYKNDHSFISSLLLILIIAYNPWTLNFKSEIMSEIPFMVVLMLTILLYRKCKHIVSYIIIGLLCGYLLSIRTIGIVLPLAILADISRNMLITYRKNGHLQLIETTRELLKIGIIFSSCLGLYYLLNHIIFKIPSNMINGYFFIFHFEHLDKVITDNLASYIENIKSFFNPKNDRLAFLPLITNAVAFSMILIGACKKFIKKIDFTDFFVLIYFIVLLIYPYKQSGFRFLFPLLPFLLNYAIVGLKSIDPGISIRRRFIALFLGLLVLIQYYYGINEILKVQDKIQEGPCSADSWIVFDYIKKNTPEDAVIAFIKPRALALFTGRKCISNNPKNADCDPGMRKLDEANTNYYLIYCYKEGEQWSPFMDEMTNIPLENYIARNKNITQVWSYDRYRFFKRIKFR